jgi:hypothetical protein
MSLPVSVLLVASSLVNPATLKVLIEDFAASWHHAKIFAAPWRIQIPIMANSSCPTALIDFVCLSVSTELLLSTQCRARRCGVRGPCVAEKPRNIFLHHYFAGCSAKTTFLIFLAAYIAQASGLLTLPKLPLCLRHKRPSTQTLDCRVISPFLTRRSYQISKAQFHFRTMIHANPEAIFLPKFENATSATRDMYGCLDKEGNHVLVAAVKSSGSLWIASSRESMMVATSKNGSSNVYSLAGHYALVCRLQQEFGSEWRQAYHNLLSFLEQNSLSLGCELVTRCLGEHASVPRQDHLVVNAVLNKITMEPCSPMALIEICRNFRLLSPGLFWFSSPAHFFEAFDSFNHNPSATWAEVSAFMEQAACRSFPMQYEALHSPIVEGFVCSMVPRSVTLTQWLEKPCEDMSESCAQPCSHQEALKSISDLYEECGCSLDMLHKEMEEQLQALGAVSHKMVPAPVDEVLAFTRRADQENQSDGAVMFRNMVQTLERLAIPHAFKCFRDKAGHLVCVHILQDWGFARYEKERAANPAMLLPPLLRGNSWYVCTSDSTPAQEDSIPSTPTAVISEMEKASLIEVGTRYRKRREDSMSADDFPQPLKVAKRHTVCSMSDILAAPGPKFGATFKFKLLSYTHRTFLLRNCGSTLAKTSDMSACVHTLQRLLLQRNCCSPDDSVPFFLSPMIHVHSHLIYCIRHLPKRNSSSSLDEFELITYFGCIYFWILFAFFHGQSAVNMLQCPGLGCTSHS